MSFRLKGLTFEKINTKSNFTGLRAGFLCSLEFYRTAIFFFDDIGILVQMKRGTILQRATNRR